MAQLFRLIKGQGGTMRVIPVTVSNGRCRLCDAAIQNGGNVCDACYMRLDGIFVRGIPE